MTSPSNFTGFVMSQTGYLVRDRESPWHYGIFFQQKRPTKKANFFGGVWLPHPGGFCWNFTSSEWENIAELRLAPGEGPIVVKVQVNVEPKDS